jgi:hypothetical protein
MLELKAGILLIIDIIGLYVFESLESDMKLLKTLLRPPATTSSPSDDLGKAYRKLRCDWTVEINHPFLLISEVQRSGGTLLSQLFDGHPECFAHPAEVKLRKPKWLWPQVDLSQSAEDCFNQIDEPWIQRYVDQGYYSKSSSKESQSYPFVFDKLLQRQIFRQQFIKNPPTHQRQVLDYYWSSFFNAWLDYQNLYPQPKKFVTGFIPRLNMYPESLSHFFADYPDGYLITTVRHPASWYASAIRHENLEKGASLEETLEPWRVSTESSIKAASHDANRVIPLLFEDVVSQTKLVMRHICEKTGLTYMDKLCSPTFNGIPMESNSHYQASTQVDAEVAHRYRNVLSPEVIRDVEGLTLDLYKTAQAQFSLKLLR